MLPIVTEQDNSQFISATVGVKVNIDSALFYEVHSEDWTEHKAAQDFLMPVGSKPNCRRSFSLPESGLTVAKSLLSSVPSSCKAFKI